MVLDESGMPDIGKVFHLFFKPFKNFIYLFMTMLGLCCCRGFSLVAVSELLTVLASLAGGHRL